jgi:hypothetical protein
MILENVTLIEDSKAIACFRGRMSSEAAGFLLSANNADTKVFTSLYRDGKFLLREENLSLALEIMQD